MSQYSSLNNLCTEKKTQLVFFGYSVNSEVESI